MENTINLGNTLGTFKKEFIDKVITVSKDIREININDIDAKSTLQTKRAELLSLRGEIEVVRKFLNQDIPVITGKVIEIKKYEAEQQKEVSIFEFEGIKMLSTDNEEE